MSEKTKKFESDLDRLINKGETLHAAIEHEYSSAETNQQLRTKLGEEEMESLIKNLPNFRSEYQSWYSEALVLIKQVLPDRLDDFITYYEYPRVRKEITGENYRIRDYLQGISITQGYRRDVVVDGRAAIPIFAQQLNIVKAAKETLKSSLIELTSILQADLFDSEIDSARALAKSGFLRAAGAICGVVIEKHLKQVCNTHGITIKKKNPVISDLNQALKDKNSISVPQWRFIQHLADIRNICDHDKGKEPDKNEIDDLTSGTDKVLKTIF